MYKLSGRILSDAINYAITDAQAGKNFNIEDANSDLFILNVVSNIKTYLQNGFLVDVIFTYYNNKTSKNNQVVIELEFVNLAGFKTINVWLK